jgi:hypothetical protein
MIAHTGSSDERRLKSGGILVRSEQKLNTMRAAAVILRLAANPQWRGPARNKQNALTIASSFIAHYLEWTSSLLILFRETSTAN